MNGGLLSLLLGTVSTVAAPSAPGPSASVSIARHVLPNGVTVLIREDRSSRIAAASAFMRIGAQHETRANAGIRQFVHEMLLRGTTKLTGEQMLDLVEARGASLDLEIGDDYVELFATGGGEDLGALVRLMGQALTEPAFPPAEVEKVRVELLSELARREDNLLDRMLESLRAGLFQDKDDEPVQYGLPAAGFSDSVQRLRRQDLVDFFRAHYVAPRLVLAVSGDVNFALILRDAQQAFGKLPGGPPPPGIAPVAPRGGEPRVTVMQSPAPQAWVAVGFRVPGVTHADYPALAVLSNLLGYGMKSRYFVEFRQRAENAGAYEVGTELSVRPHQADFIAYAQVNALEIDDAKNRLLREFTRLSSEPPAAAELERAKRVTVGAFVLEHQRQRQRAHHLALFETLGVGYTFDANYPDRVRRVTAEDVRRAAAAHFQTRAVVVALPDPGLAPPMPQTPLRR